MVLRNAYVGGKTIKKSKGVIPITGYLSWGIGVVIEKDKYLHRGFWVNTNFHFSWTDT